ncbi:hypothetical protein DK847_14375 [Aestuariivirga litoralis]|uniref:Extensin-like C-terminal domain-containing protein n=1 Tax=Aestuariivirga litoralis TaxID=2650924 RepID=A0A2W2ALU3_9HYPH|nr:extensin family protein [Aestuariivirga litoralis]PZF76361.1 hypothetical protein DK847_14375 [Aestuariivirga litoralis]
MQPVKALLILAAAWLAAAPAAGAAEPVPKPKLRPELAAQVSPAASVPVPRLRPPAEMEAAPADAVPVPQPRPLPEAVAPQSPTPAAPMGVGGWPAATIEAARAECRTLLKGLDLAYAPLGPIGEQGGCGAPAPVEVTAVAGVKLSPPATQTCDMAAALARWVIEDVQPAARQRLGTEVTEIRTATSYACRRRNNGSSGKMSEHSKANALDMSGFQFAKTGVSVGGKDNWGEGLLGALGLSKGGSFLEDIRKAACTHFTTVLGPGSDPFHGDHFHVDVLRRKGDYRICQ